MFAGIAERASSGVIDCHDKMTVFILVSCLYNLQYLNMFCIYFT